MTPEQEAIYFNYLEILRSKLITKYDELGLRASGKFEESLEPEVNKSSMIMYGADHSKFMENGRGTGPSDYRKLAPFIERWIENKKGLPNILYERKDQIKFAIAHKIATQGITVPNEHNAGGVISEVVSEFIKTDIPNMLNELGDVFLSRIRVDVIDILKEELTAA